MVKGKPHSEKRWKQGRLSIRIHDDLRSALDFMADEQHRALSNYIETALIAHARERLANAITNDGEGDGKPWRLRDPYYRNRGLNLPPPKK